MLKSANLKLPFTSAIIFLLICCSIQNSWSQVLSKPVTLNINRERLADALNELGKAGNFHFSYNGQILSRDSIVSISADQLPAGTILKRLLGERYEWEERENYVIISLALRRLSMANTDLTTDDKSYSVSGIVTDVVSGERLMNASVYEKHRLIATLTDDHGYFRLKFRAGDSAAVSLTASKLAYRDTTLNLLYPVKVSFSKPGNAYQNARNKGNRVETNGFGRLFISARQKIQSLNIPDFFASRPFQVSLTPGLSSHGMFSPQVVNKFSLNLVGGYTAGVDGVEFGGFFNINKQDSRYLQVAGIFNLVGGSVHGAQLAGVHNFAIDTVKGVQLAGFINQSTGQVSGLQLSSLHNEARHLKGVQIGLVNQADTSDGASIGLINLIGNGFYRVSLTANNLMAANLALKTGTHAFYSILMAGMNTSAQQKMYAFGLGAGHDFLINNKFYASAEVNYQIANTGLWDDRWTQGKLLFNYQLCKNISLIAGPTYNHYNHSGSYHLDGYQNITSIPDYPAQAASGHQTKNWLGWEAGLSFNSVFRQRKPGRDDSYSWYVGVGGTAGAGWSKPYSKAYGAELFAQRDLGNHLSAIVSLGYTTFAADKNYIFYHNMPTPDYGTEFLAMPYRIIPLKFGIRSMISKGFYIGGDLGQSWAKKDDGFYIIDRGVKHRVLSEPQTVKSFVFAATAGYDFGSGLDAGFKFENYTGFSEIRQFALRFAYKIKLSK